MKKKIGSTLRRVLDGNAGAHATFTIARPIDSGFLDHLHADASGLIRLEGWSREPILPERHPQLFCNGAPVSLLQHFRVARPDVQPPAHALQTGVAWEFLLMDMLPGATLDLNLPDSEVLSFELPFAVVRPHYDMLFQVRDVLHRPDIYLSGPPNEIVHPEVLELAKQLSGPVLDFGCGRGTLVAALIAEGKQADGLEMDTPMLREAIAPQLRYRIKLYDGTLPAPFSDASYQSVVCSEVLEHIPDFQAAVADIARITREQALFTVPDASAIATGHRHGVVPWHLLEGTHLNFFSQASLENTLRPHFRRIEFGRAGTVPLNDTSFFVSLTANCWK